MIEKDGPTPLDLLMVGFGAIFGIILCWLLLSVVFMLGFRWGVIVFALGIPMVHPRAPAFLRGLGYMFLLTLVISVIIVIWSLV